MMEALLRACRDVAGVARLFDALGYRTDARVVDDQALGTLGVQAHGLPVHHLFRGGGIDLYVVQTDTEADRSRVRELSDRLADRNHVIRPVIAELHGCEPRMLSIHGRNRDRRRRLDIDLLSPSADAIDRVCGLLIRGRAADDVDPAVLFERALDREALGRRFFDQFRRSVGLVAGELSDHCPGEPPAERHDQALLLLSRVLFVYLIQRKGWLDGDRGFLRERLATCIRRGSCFHASIVKPLFFDCLNRPAKRRPSAARRLGTIPYLNGGLFEPSSFERRNPSTELSNDLWRNILDSTFEPFALSVSEADEEGTHLDPEMLGKVFEKLMEGEERARTGSFYTPRKVVDCLTQAAIVRWCADGDAILTDQLRAVIQGVRPDIDGVIAKRLLRRLESITVLDPACGSGAFLLAALRTIEMLTVSLAALAGETPPVDLRARIAAASLYGVDLKPEAVRLCELRLWLAIVSSENLEVDSIPPLPNLDRNVMQGNSLVDPFDFLAGERTGIYRDWVRGLRERERLLDDYRRSTSTRRRNLAATLRESDRSLARRLVDRIITIGEEELRAVEESDRGLFEGAPVLSGRSRHTVEDHIRSGRDLRERLERDEISFFSFDLHFATVRARGGFSVVLGNPPWVRGSMVDAGLRRLLADRYSSFRTTGVTGFRQAELAMAFVERSLSLLGEDGVVAQLLPSKVTSADYASAVRRLLTKDAFVLEMHDWSTEGRRLFAADVFPLGLVASRMKSDEPVRFRTEAEGWVIERDELAVAGEGSAWSTLSPEVRKTVRRLRERHAFLEDVLGRRPVMGVKTGANARFFLADVEVVNGEVSVPSLGMSLPAGAVVRAVRGRDVRRWVWADATWMLWPAGINGDRALVRALARRLGVAQEALRLSYVKSEHLGLKVAWKDVSRGLAAAVLPDRTLIDGMWFSVVPNQTLYSLDVTTKDEGYGLAALLNSTVANALALETAERAKDHHWRYQAGVVASLPIPGFDAASEEWRALARLARRAESGDEDLRELNRLVARLYGVGPGELERLERFVDARLGRSGGDQA